MDIEELLKELGWSDGFHIPVANEENKALELEVCFIFSNLNAFAPPLLILCAY